MPATEENILENAKPTMITACATIIQRLNRVAMAKRSTGRNNRIALASGSSGTIVQDHGGMALKSQLQVRMIQNMAAGKMPAQDRTNSHLSSGQALFI